MDFNFLYDFILRYGVYAIFALVMVEGDITLLLAGVLAQRRFLGEHSFAWVLLAGTLGGAASDNIASSWAAILARCSQTKLYAPRNRHGALTNTSRPPIFFPVQIRLRWARAYSGRRAHALLRFVIRRR